MKRLLVFTFAMFILAACNKEFGDVPQSAENANIVIRASIEGYKENIPDTKTTIFNFGDPTYGLEQSAWLAGDEIAVHFYDDMATDPNYAVKSIFKATGSGPNVEFVWDRDIMGALPTSGEYDIRAIYPADIAGYYFSDLSQTQNGNNADHIGPLDVMSAQKIDVEMSDPDALKLSFTHEMPLLRFSLKNSDTEHDITIENITISQSSSSNLFFSSISYGDIKGNAEPFITTKNFGLNCSSTIIGKNGGIKDFYMILPTNEVNDLTDDFKVLVSFKKNSETAVGQEFNISRSTNPFLQVPFDAGNCYYFKLVVTDPNITTHTDASGILYIINTSTNKARLSGLTSAISGPVTILSTLPGYPGSSVTSIDDSAFDGQTGITSVTLPGSIENIDRLAFQGCTNLATITFDGTSNLKTIGISAFQESGLTGITIPASVIDIGEAAFKDCKQMEEVLFASGSSLKSIGESAFYGCSNTSFDEIDIPSVKTIGQSAFAFCKYLKTVTLPANLGSIDNYAFQKTNLQKLNLYCLNPPKLGTPYGIFSDIDNSIDLYPPHHVILVIYIPYASNFPAWNSELKDPNHPLGWTNTRIDKNLDLNNSNNELYENLSNASNDIFSAGTPGNVLIQADF